MTTSRGPTLSLLTLCVLGALVHSSSAITHTVSWTIPSSDTFYDDWAAAQIFKVGDIIEFDYVAGHNVLAVSPKDVANCDASNPLQEWNGASPKVSLDSPGKHNFMCGVPGHCPLGMKVTLQVLPAAPVPAPPTPELPPPTKPPPSPASPEISPPPTKPPPTPATPDMPPPPPPAKHRSTPPPQPEAPVEAPVPSPPKKKKSLAPVPAPLYPTLSLISAHTPSIAPAPFPETAAASVLKSTAFVIVATLLASCWAILF